MADKRTVSLPHAVQQAGGIDAWNAMTPEAASLLKTVNGMCNASTVEEALKEVDAIMCLGHGFMAYAYMRALYDKDMDLYYGALLSAPSKLLPIVYTPTVGEACQKFGKLPFYSRGCYVTIDQRGTITKTLTDYAEAHLEKGPDGKYMVDCIVFSDGGRILGLGDLGAWGMGIPIGKLDLYTVCAGVNPFRTVPVIIDAGIHPASGNTARIDIRNDPRYTGLKEGREVHTSAAGTAVNTAYYGEGNMIEEFMSAAVEVFGETVLLQFEDFNSNDAFPLLDIYRNKYLTYNDDIQGTASIAVAGILGAMKLQSPEEMDLIRKLPQETFLFHGAGSANLGGAFLLHKEGGVPMERIFVTNSKGLIWRAGDASGAGTFKNDEQKAVAAVGEPDFPHKDLLDIIAHVKPTVVVGAVGVSPGCFTRAVVEKLVEVNTEDDIVHRPVLFALSNPKTQAEITATDAYTWSNGQVIFGSGTQFDPVAVFGRTHCPGQVNNVYIFPGASFAAVQCQATSIPERLFLVAAEAVANSLNAADLQEDRVVPNPARIREVALSVATAVVWECQALGLARKPLGQTQEQVKAALSEAMWSPDCLKGAHPALEEPRPPHASLLHQSIESYEPLAEVDLGEVEVVKAGALKKCGVWTEEWSTRYVELTSQGPHVILQWKTPADIWIPSPYDRLKDMQAAHKGATVRGSVSIEDIVSCEAINDPNTKFCFLIKTNKSGAKKEYKLSAYLDFMETNEQGESLVNEWVETINHHMQLHPHQGEWVTKPKHFWEK